MSCNGGGGDSRLNNKNKISFLKKELLGSLFVISVFVVILISLNSLMRESENQPYIDEGVLDLHNWDADTDNVIVLKGGWNFYWKQLLNTNTLQKEKLDDVVTVPDVWNRYDLASGKQTSGFGYATYQIKVKNIAPKEKLALKIPTISTAYRVLINDKEITSAGVVGQTKATHKPEYKQHIIAFEAPASEFDIVVQVSNFSYARGGIWYTFTLGSEEQIQRLERNMTRTEMVIFGALLIMVMYYLSYYLFLRRDLASLLFAIGCSIFLVRIPIMGEHFIQDILPNVPFEAVVAIEYYTYIWLQLPFMLLVKRMFPQEISRIPILIHLYAAIIYSLVVLFTPVSFYTQFTNVFHLIIVFGMVTTIISVAKAIKHKRENAILYFVGLIIAAGTAIFDILNNSSIIKSAFGEILSFGLFIFLFIQAFVITKRFSDSFNKVEVLSERLLSMDKLKDEFLANTSHELQTPLNGIITISESLIRGVDGQVNEKQKQNLELIVASGNRLSNLVYDILDYSQLKYGDIKIFPRPLSLEQIVVSIVEMHRFFISGKSVDIVYYAIRDIYVMADEKRLNQIIHNLLGNAIKFTEKGKIEIFAEQHHDTVLIHIKDTGIGIPKEKQLTIFQSFEQVDPSITRKYGGTGLGLSITKKLVELHQGDISVSSEVGKGTTFTFSIPKATSYEAATTEKEITMLIDKPVNLFSSYDDMTYIKGSKQETVFVVDDDQINLHALINLLKLEGYSIIAFRDSEKAWDYLSKQQSYPALLILDVMMPKLSGYEFCKLVRKRWTVVEMPVLMLTANHRKEEVLAAFEVGANDFLSKPFETKEFQARIRTLIELNTWMRQSKESEMAFLQAQIKPHFLYNTLNTIVTYCEEDPQKAGDLILDLATYLRRSFDFTRLDHFIPLEKELELVRAYVNIEKERFRDKLQVEFEAPINYMHKMIPVLVVQPIVENAIRHGVLKKKGGGTVKISFYDTDQHFVIQVSDEGVGMTEQQLQSILLNEPHHGAERKGVGIANIHNRLLKLYGEGLQVTSEVGKGTNVLIFIPIGEK